MTRLRSRKTLLALAGIILLATILRVVNLTGRTLWYDEAFAMLFAQAGWDAMVDGTLTPVEGGAADVHPLLYYELLHLWMRAFGASVAAVRLLSVALGVLTVVAVYVLARDWFGARTGLAAALITAVAPFHVQYSQETRMYALLALALALTTWLYWRAWTLDRWVYWAAFAFLAAVSMYTQQLAAFYLAALGLLPLILREWRLLGRTIVAAGVAFALYLPWFLHLPDQLGKLEQYWVERPNVLHIWLALRSFFSVNLDFDPTWWLPTFFLAAVLPVLLAFRAWHTFRRSPDAGERHALTWALWLGFAPIGLTWIASVVFQPVFLPRALLPSAVIVYIALAWLFVRGGMPRVVTAIVLAAWAVIAVFGLATHYTWDTFPTPPFDRAAEFLRRSAAEGDAIVHGNKITALPLRIYAPDLPQTYVRDVPGSGSDTLAVPTQRAIGWLASDCPAEAAGGAARVWYVAFEQFDAEMAEAAVDDPRARAVDSGAWLRAHYSEGSSVRFNDLVVTQFTGPDEIAQAARCEEPG